jgi:hypothetical protein
MSLRFNKDHFSDPTGPSRQWVFGVFLYKNLQPISLIVTVKARYIEISYDFGIYKHTIKMNSDGYAEEKVWRSGKLLTHGKISTQPNFEYDTDPSSNLPYLKSYFVAGAANGFLGMGITREERFPDVYIKVMLYERRFCFQVVQQQIDLNILTVSIEPSSFDMDYEGSHMGQLLKGPAGIVERRISPPVNAATAEEMRTKPIAVNEAQSEVATLKKWYESEFGIGEKTSDLFLMSYEVRRQFRPDSGYQVLYSHPRKEGQHIPKFIPATEIDKPLISGSTVTSLCPSCNTRAAAKLEEASYFACRKCKLTWWQKR